MSRHLAAYTARGTAFPPFVSIDEEVGKVKIIVRSPMSERKPGVTASIEMPKTEFDALILEAQKRGAERV